MRARKFYRDGLEEEIIGEVITSETGDGHTVESYTTKNGEKKFFVTIAGSHLCAHGRSVAEAVADALWKDEKNRPPREELVKKIRAFGQSYKLTLNEFRHLTGACLAGCESALLRAGVKEREMTPAEIYTVVSKEWGRKLLDILGWEAPGATRGD